MKYKKSIIVGICILSILFAWKTGAARANEAVPEMHLEERENYVRVSLGRCYPGKTVEYDISYEKTIMEPLDGQKQIVVRNKDKAVLYYGKFKGREEYDNYQMISPVLDARFFFNPFQAVVLDVEQIAADGFHTKIEEEQEIEYFLTACVCRCYQ